MDKSDSEKFAELEQQLADRQSRDERLGESIDALLRDDLIVLDKQLKQSNIQGKLDQIVGWYNYKMDELGKSKYKLRINELIKPVTQLTGLDTLDKHSNFNEHHSLIAYAWRKGSEEQGMSVGSHWLDEFNAMDEFKIQIVCTSNFSDKEHKILFMTNYNDWSLEYVEYKADPTLAELETQLQAILVEMVKFWSDSAEWL